VIVLLETGDTTDPLTEVEALPVSVAVTGQIVVETAIVAVTMTVLPELTVVD